MKTSYSKSIDEVLKERADLEAREDEILQRQQQLVEKVKSFPQRVNCILCNNKIEAAETFSHRGQEFLVCRTCGHIQTVTCPPEQFPSPDDTELSFSKIYPELSKEEFQDRRDRIYTPKLDWFFECAVESGISKKSILERSWLDLGCGSGYLVSAVQEAGIANVQGAESDKILAERANVHLDNDPIKLWPGNLTDAVSESEASIFSAIFVLEHISDVNDLVQTLSKKPAGTLFFFSVPVFSFACVVDNVFENRFARVFDGAVHTQMFTEQSIDYMLDLGKMEKIGEWIFGSDVADLFGYMIKTARNNFQSGLFDEIESKLHKLIDPVQQVVDKAHFADSKHILAVRK